MDTEVNKGEKEFFFPYLQGLIECDTPNSDLYEFKGILRLQEIENQALVEKFYSLTGDQLLLKGS